jgi:hypothetical protein
LKKISIYLWLVLVMVIVPVNAYAAADKVITHKEFIDYKYQCTYYEDGTRFLNNLINSNDDDTGEEVWIAGSYFKPKEYSKLVANMNGSYQENGLKISTVLNGKTKKINETGKYAIVVGGEWGKDYGYIKFIAPKTEKYKFTFDVRNNVARDRICIRIWDTNLDKEFKLSKHQYYDINGNNEVVYDPIHDRRILLTPTSEPATDDPTNIIRFVMGEPEVIAYSVEKKMSGTIRLKKGESILLRAEYCNNDRYLTSDDEDEKLEKSYNYVGFDLKISCK